jgi:hypothetical protein
MLNWLRTAGRQHNFSTLAPPLLVSLLRRWISSPTSGFEIRRYCFLGDCFLDFSLLVRVVSRS